ncbi:MAG: TIGR00730 family Rossman fold protein [Candidatus Babeliales bacterium]
MIKQRIYFYYVLVKGLLVMAFQLIYGVWKVSRLPAPIVTIFGGARLKQDDPIARHAHELSHRLARAEISVISGGGPGIMQAVNCGVRHEEKLVKARTLGITVKGLSKTEPVNPCAQDFIVTDQFAVRKWLMINFSVAFIVFPGGFGTVDEFAEVITLMQTKKLPGVPVILVGAQYWDLLIRWLKESALPKGLVSQKDLDLIYVTDDLEDIVCKVKEQCALCTPCA